MYAVELFVAFTTHFGFSEIAGYTYRFYRVGDLRWPRSIPLRFSRLPANTPHLCRECRLHSNSSYDLV
jgi:hypothetical protein